MFDETRRLPSIKSRKIPLNHHFPLVFLWFCMTFRPSRSKRRSHAGSRSGSCKCFIRSLPSAAANWGQVRKAQKYHLNTRRSVNAQMKHHPILGDMYNLQQIYEGDVQNSQKKDISQALGKRDFGETCWQSAQPKWGKLGMVSSKIRGKNIESIYPSVASSQSCSGFSNARDSIYRGYIYIYIYCMCVCVFRVLFTYDLIRFKYFSISATRMICSCILDIH